MHTQSLCVCVWLGRSKAFNSSASATCHATSHLKHIFKHHTLNGLVVDCVYPDWKRSSVPTQGSEQLAHT
jgi:hypothetical protein